jgi:molybdate transport system permease protein
VTPEPTGRPPAWALALAAGAVAFLALPLVALLTRVPWAAAPALVARPDVQAALRLSLGVAALSAALALALGGPVAWLLARVAFPGRLLVRTVVLLPLVLPPVVGGTALLAAFGRRGLVGAWLAPFGLSLPFTTAGAVLAATFVAAPLVILTLEAGLLGLDRRLEGAAATLGASRWHIARAVVLPALWPALLAAAALAAARALGEFGATITFAGNRPGVTQTLPLAVYELLQTDPGAAALVSLLLLLVSLGLLALAWGVRGPLAGRRGAP